MINSLSSLIYDLVKLGSMQAASDVIEILHQFVEDDEEKLEDDEEELEKGENNPISAVNIIGLRGDVKPEQPTGGFSLEPFFMDRGDPF
jgi:hypothetical protein